MSLYWTPRTDDDYDHLVGYDVYAADGEKVGTISKVLHPERIPDNVGENYFLVKPSAPDRWQDDGKELRLSESMVRSITPDENRVTLSVLKRQVEQERST